MSLTNSQKKLLEEYRKLPEFSKQVLVLFSLAYLEVNQTKIFALVNSPPFKAFRYGTIKLDTLKHHLQELKQLTLLNLSEGKAFRCNPEILEIIARESIKEGTFLVAARTIEYAVEESYRMENNDILVLGRIGLYRGDKDIFGEFERIKTSKRNYYSLKDSDYYVLKVLSVLNNPYDPEFMQTFEFPSDYFEMFYGTIISLSIENGIPNPEATEFVIELCKKQDKRITGIIPDLVCEDLLFQGRLKERDEIYKLTQKIHENANPFNDGIKYFIQNKADKAIPFFESGIVYRKRTTNKKNYLLESYLSVVYFFVLLKTGESDNYQTAMNYSARIAKEVNHPFRFPFQSLYGLCLFVSGLERDANRINLGYLPPSSEDFWNVFVFGIVLYWTNPSTSHKSLTYLKKSLTNVRKSNYKWMEMQLLDLITKIEKTESKEALELKKELGSFFISDTIEKKEDWHIILNALSSLKSKTAAVNTNQPDKKRIAWFIGYDKKRNTVLEIHPIEQSYSEKTGWSAGKPISLKRLKTDSSKIPFLLEQDIRATNYIRAYSQNYYGGLDYSLDANVLLELVGHPYLFWMDLKTRFDLERGEPELTVEENEADNTIQLLLHPEEIKDEERFTLQLETPSRLKLIVFSKEHRQIAKILSGLDVKIPREAKEQVLKAITNLSSSILIQSDIGGAESQTEKVEATSTPYLQLIPYDAGLRVTGFCRPFTGKGPYYKPGKGGKNLIADIEGKKLSTTRNLLEEELRFSELLRLCPTLQSINLVSEYEWILESPETCLEVLSEIQTIGDIVVIEWPEGERFRIKKQADISKFHMGIKKDNDWFSVNGTLDLGNKEIIEMQVLLELLGQSQSRFIKMNDGSFLALTATFRKQLDELRAFSESTKEGLRFSPLISPLMEDFASQVASLKADKAWKAQLERLKEIKDFKPELPNTLQATLRDYQTEGYEWLARLSHWGVGACLADDMGLGKTIQSLAILLTRAAKGPSLVIAPSSVCMNWHTESLRFAPTLNTIQYGGNNRIEIIENLKPFDLIVCSYGMIQQEDVAETFKSVDWQVIILDEAQAIKNMSTKRSQAVMSLKAGFRLLTTGTPIENHLGELWNLFRFLNPGLLGSMEKFNERYAIPIERYKDKTVRNQLKKLIQPFILRRLKNQVLDELPEKTDITLQVELSDKERSFYEALRLNAIKKLTSKEMPAGQKHLQILAEIMKLRRACCNTKLVEAKMDLPSSKFEAFIEILEELLENKHKALVFSQFVDHLSLIRKYLEEKKISFQYLDGSTTMKDRKLRVDAFQRGEGEVFLISLKAGGTGLNLTAADYVIHMDPWWNPAVEDQASDRAHRIGQKRPVTVYRLVAKDTIEEKIVNLHKHKRDLADSLLEETDMSGKISADELLSLLKGG